PVAAEQALREGRRTLAGHDAVERAVDRDACREPRQGPQLLLGGPTAHRVRHQRVGQLGARRRPETLAAPDGLPHLSQRLRARPRSIRLAPGEERRRQVLEQMLLLAGVESAGYPLPQVPPLRPALRGTRMAKVRTQHAPETIHSQVVAGIAEAGPQEEA